ncbi:hypothetical protein [Parvularcula marina]|uniref:Uncharacterized protein n=1 Tax=Parvularcula marina TaxID=2292771 RepID=A0A371RIB2_9PROT|nr:hypothetical protein [Parvularcula marina]RFB05199.1 hypothetical protein DX908_07980 [Parvularcula marina]
MANQFVAYQDERHGLAAWVAEQIAADLFRNQAEPDAPLHEVTEGQAPEASMRAGGAPSFTAESYGMRLSAGGRDTALMEGPAPRQRADQGLDKAYRTWTSPRTSAESIMSTVIAGQAQVGVLPLYDNDKSFSRDTLNALIDFPPNRVIREYVAESNYVLAAPADLIHEIEQSGYTDSFSGTGSSQSFQWNRDKQQRYLRKVTTIFASADAMRHCSAALEGFRARGIEVQTIPDGADSYRKGLEVASEYLDPNRRVETYFSNASHTRVSKSRGANHNKPVIAVLLSADKAMSPDGYAYDSDYVVLEAEMAGADRIRTSFIALQKGIPAIPPEDIDPLRYEMASLRQRFKAPKKSGGGADHRALYPIAGDKPNGAPQPEGVPAYVRCLYKCDTVGNGVKDISPVIRALAEQKLSYTTTTLDGRPGHPIVFAIDVPADRWEEMRPVLRQITRMTNYRRLADFPAIQPMIKETIRPKTATTARGRTAMLLIGGIVVAVAAFAFMQMGG